MALIQSNVSVTRVGKLDSDTFQNTKPLTTQPSGRSVFGGLLLAQAVSAASATVPPSFHVYFQQSSFLRPIAVKAQDTAGTNAQNTIAYRVDRINDGRTSATRVVRAYQASRGGECVHIATISFQSSHAPAANVLRYGIPLPDRDGLNPEDISEDLHRQIIASSAKGSTLWQLMSPEGEPFDWRPFGLELTDKPWDVRTRGFCRSPTVSTDAPHVHLAALAYLSDEILLGVPIYANPDKTGSRTQNITMAATLNHTMHFHDPTTRIDKWKVVERETMWGDDGRTLVHQRIWDLESGRLVMSCTQEALIRLRDAKL